MTRDEAAEKLYPPELVVSNFAYDDDWCRERTKEKAAFCAGWDARDDEVEQLKTEMVRLEILVSIADELITNENAKNDWEAVRGKLNDER